MFKCLCYLKDIRESFLINCFDKNNDCITWHVLFTPLTDNPIDKLLLFSSYYDQISELFYCESLLLIGFGIDLPGVVIWQHIHPSTLHSFWVKGLTRFQLPKGFLGLRSAGILLIYWNVARVPRREETSHSLLQIICKSGLDTSRYPYLATIDSPCLSIFPLFIVVHLDQST